MSIHGKRFVRLFSLLALVVVSTSSFAEAAPKSPLNTSCRPVNSLQLFNTELFACTKVGTKLMWINVEDQSSDFAPFPINGPTWQQISDLRDAESKKAAELKAKLEAEAKVAAELKAKLEAEAKAAKAAAEVPKVAGLTIGKLLWGDDFQGSKGTSINSKYWSGRNCHRVPESFGGGACFDAEVVYYAPSAIKLDGSEDGAAVISTTRVSGQLPSDAGKCLSQYCTFVSGRFDTHGKVGFKYGFIEARIKMPVGSGNHPAFWMLGENINQVGWPLSGEMDITEIHGFDPRSTTSATHFSTTNTPNACCGNHKYTVAALDVGADVTSDFHTYAVAWLPNSISYYVDNRLISTTTPAMLGGYWSFNENFFLILNNAVNESFSGSWQNLQSSSMTIDWVRSYQLNGVGEVFTK